MLYESFASVLKVKTTERTLITVRAQARYVRSLAKWALIRLNLEKKES